MSTLSTAERVLEGLSEAQRAAASYLEGPLIIVAGPGSGKTRVMSHRMAYILASGVPAWQALGVTFTNKAAAELRQRCERLVAAHVPGSEDANVSTFHAFGARFLRLHPDSVQLNRDFSIYDRDDQQRLVKLIADQMDIDVKVNEVLAAIGTAKNNNQNPDDLAATGADYKTELHAEIYAQYESNLKLANAVDFDDLLLLPYQVLARDDALRARYQKRYQHIMLDEFQDTNSLQFELVRLLGDVHRNVCVVGDPDQSIYSWRNARPENMGLLAEVMEGCRIFHLSESYRSTKTIIEAADKLIKNNGGRFERTLFTNNPDGEKVKISAATDPEHEAVLVLDAIEEATDGESRGNGRSETAHSAALNEMAILYRTNAQSRALETECSRRGVQYRLIGGVRFYERREIKDALALLRIVVNPSDETSLRRIINVPPRGIGPVTLTKLEQYSHYQQVSLLDAVMLANDPAASGELGLGRSALRKVGAFAEFVSKMTQNSQELLPDDLLDLALKGSGYLDWIRRDEATRVERTENLDELKSLAEKYSNREEDGDPRQALSELLEHASLFTNVDDMALGAGSSEGENAQTSDFAGGAVTLITLHQAKGLEYDHVFIVGVCEGLLPHSMALDVADQDRYEAACGEERRLMYVGMTRAKRRLHLLWPRQRFRGGSENKQSRFIAEIPSQYVEVVNRAAISVPAAPSPVAFSSGLNGDRSRKVPRRKFTEVGLDDLPEELRYKAGERVSHAQFGSGVVVNSRPVGDDVRLTVAFGEAGVKTLMAGMASLERI